MYTFADFCTFRADILLRVSSFFLFFAIIVDWTKIEKDNFVRKQNLFDNHHWFFIIFLFICWPSGAVNIPTNDVYYKIAQCKTCCCSVVIYLFIFFFRFFSEIIGVGLGVAVIVYCAIYAPSYSGRNRVRHLVTFQFITSHYEWSRVLTIYEFIHFHRWNVQLHSHDPSRPFSVVAI